MIQGPPCETFANKMPSVVNQMELNATTQPPSQTSSLMQLQPPRQIAQGQYRKFKDKYHKHQGRHHHPVQLVSSTDFSTRT